MTRMIIRDKISMCCGGRWLGIRSESCFLPPIFTVHILTNQNCSHLFLILLFLLVGGQRILGACMKRGGAASCGEGIQGSECAGSARPRGAHADEEFVASRGSYTTVRTVPAPVAPPVSSITRYAPKGRDRTDDDDGH